MVSFVCQAITLWLAIALQYRLSSAANSVTDGNVDRTWVEGGFTITFQVNLEDGVTGGWAVVMALNYTVDKMNVSLKSVLRACYIIIYK